MVGGSFCFHGFAITLFVKIYESENKRFISHVNYRDLFHREISLCKLQKRCTRIAAASDKVYQLLAHGRWFSPGTSASSTTETGRYDLAEIYC
jgi:hypothetical protein